MKLLFKQRGAFSWLESFDVYDEQGETVYVVEGQSRWKPCLNIYDKAGDGVGMIQGKVLTLFPRFKIYMERKYVGCIRRELAILENSYTVDFKNWYVEGSFMGWEYYIYNERQEVVGVITKKVLNWTDTYVIDVNDSRDGLAALMLVLAIDVEKSYSR